MVGCLEWQLTHKYINKLVLFKFQMIENQSQLVHVYVGLE